MCALADSTQEIVFRDLRTQWHPAFCAAAKIELLSNKEELEFQQEYNLSKKPLQIDLLIIEKTKDVSIDNEIGRIFRRFNVIEYKSPKDGLTIDDFIKTIGYACIYKGLGEKVNQVPLHELTVSVFREEKPEKMMRDIERDGGKIEKVSDGIYYVKDMLIPAQIVVIKELNGAKHRSLRILSPRAQEDDIRGFLNEAKDFSEPGEKADADAVLQVSVSENMELYNEIMGRYPEMCEALKTLMKDEIDQEKKAVEKETTERVAFDMILNTIKKMMKNQGQSAVEAMRVLEIPESEQEKYLAKLQ